MLDNSSQEQKAFVNKETDIAASLVGSIKEQDCFDIILSKASSLFIFMFKPAFVVKLIIKKPEDSVGLLTNYSILGIKIALYRYSYLDVSDSYTIHNLIHRLPLRDEVSLIYCRKSLFWPK